MKIAVYDPLKAFTPFLEHCGKSHEVTWIDIPVTSDELRWQHIRNDLVWYEFCDEHFHQMMRGPKECLVVNRLHSYELFTDVPGKVDWSKVDLLCASSAEVKGLLEKRRDIVDFPKIEVLANGPDLEKMEATNGKKYGKRIAVVGAINYKKNLPLAIYCMDAVKLGGYEMHFIGASQDLRFDFYLKHLVQRLGLGDQVFFHGGMSHNEVVDVLGHMDYILSTSLYESFGQGIMEGIARGCLPLIHDFPGAQERFGGMSCLFKTPSEFAEVLSKYNHMGDEARQCVAAFNRQFIAPHELKRQLATLDSIFAYLESANA